MNFTTISQFQQDMMVANATMDGVNIGQKYPKGSIGRLLGLTVGNEFQPANWSIEELTSFYKGLRHFTKEAKSLGSEELETFTKMLVMAKKVAVQLGGVLKEFNIPMKDHLKLTQTRLTAAMKNLSNAADQGREILKLETERRSALAQFKDQNAVDTFSKA